MIDYFALINKYYQPGTTLYKLYVVHVCMVANKALEIARRLQLSLEEQILIEEGAMLHDIGICQTNVPAIGCHGPDPYIRHGLDGAAMLRQEGLEAQARIAERHLGVGLTRDYIVSRQLPLPAQDFIPQTLPEQIVTYADTFYSKYEQRLRIPDSPATIKAELGEYGPQQVQVFERWQAQFEPAQQKDDYDQ